MEDIEPRTSLRRHPDLAQLVGLIIADYALLEFQAFILLATASDRPVGDLFAEFYGWRSINNKREMALREARPRAHPHLYEAIERTWRHFLAAAERRTEIAHCLFLAPNDGVLRMRLRNGRAWYEPFSEAVFHRTIRQFRIVAEEFGVCITFAAGSRERLIQRLADIPRPRGIPLPDLSPGAPPPSGSLGPNELDRIRRRLGLHRLIRDDFLTMQVRTDFQLR